MSNDTFEPSLDYPRLPHPPVILILKPLKIHVYSANGVGYITGLIWLQCVMIMIIIEHWWSFIIWVKRSTKEHNFDKKCLFNELYCKALWNSYLILIGELIIQIFLFIKRIVLDQAMQLCYIPHYSGQLWGETPVHQSQHSIMSGTISSSGWRPLHEFVY